MVQGRLFRGSQENSPEGTPLPSRGGGLLIRCWHYRENHPSRFSPYRTEHPGEVRIPTGMKILFLLFFGIFLVVLRPSKYELRNDP